MNFENMGKSYQHFILLTLRVSLELKKIRQLHIALLLQLQLVSVLPFSKQNKHMKKKKLSELSVPSYYCGNVLAL